MPQLLATIRLVYQSPDAIYNQQKLKLVWLRTIIFILTLIFSPLLSIVLHMKQSYIQLKSDKNPKDKSLINQCEKKKWDMHQFIKLELGLEAIYQLAGQLILLLMTFTTTSTEVGFTQIFKEGPGQEGEDILYKDAISSTIENIGINTETHAIIILTLSILFSFKSCITSHLRILSAKREWFPLTSKLMAGLFSLFTCMTRILAIIMYFAPALGLFNLLHHLQAEQIPWNANIEGYFVKNGTIQFGDSNEITWKEIDRWHKDEQEHIFYSNKSTQGFELNITNPRYLVSPPSYTTITYFSLGEYFIGFCIILFVQTISVFMAKCVLCQHFKELNVFEKVLHSIENINIPFNSEEWDNGKGDAEAHQNRMKKNSREIMFVMLVNFIFNSFMLIPLVIIGINN